jgi:ammonium transporter, Amt family
MQLSVGAVRSKNAKNICLKILLDACFSALAYYLVGFALAFGGTYTDDSMGNAFIGYSGFALHGTPIDNWYHFFFQFAVLPCLPCLWPGPERCGQLSPVCICAVLCPAPVLCEDL